jgi:dienelactone hydrolase
MEEVVERGRRAAESLPDSVVYGGFSLGMLPAQMLAQTRHGCRGALLFHDCIPPSEFGTTWPEDVPLQVHTMEEDPWVDLPTVREVVRDVHGAELHVYPGSGHLFADEGSPDYDAPAAALLKRRVLDFLDALG